MNAPRLDLLNTGLSVNNTSKGMLTVVKFFFPATTIKYISKVMRNIADMQINNKWLFYLFSLPPEIWKIMKVSILNQYPMFSYFTFKEGHDVTTFSNYKPKFMNNKTTILMCAHISTSEFKYRDNIWEGCRHLCNICRWASISLNKLYSSQPPYVQ